MSAYVNLHFYTIVEFLKHDLYQLYLNSIFEKHVEMWIILTYLG